MIRAVLLMALFGLSACADRDPVAEAGRSYQGKPDSRSWDNAPLADGSATWSKGDRSSWEQAIKARQLTQDEYKRIGQ
jgi:hypothetical protein